MARRHLQMHFHRAISFQAGEASWYDGDGQGGACGRILNGLYAASRTLPCGATVSVRSGGHYVIVTILDRGPFNSSSRILDLSPKAFGTLAPLGAGVISVKAVRLRN
jgi:rare lipoprotein A